MPAFAGMSGVWAAPRPFFASLERLSSARHRIRSFCLLNRYDRNSMNGEAEVKYLDGDFRVVRPGAYVRCAVSGVPIPLEELKYWSVDRQEAYVSPEAVLKRLNER
jgi:hypothetical protein